MGSKQAKSSAQAAASGFVVGDDKNDSEENLVTVKQSARQQLADLAQVRKAVPPLQAVKPLEIQSQRSSSNQRTCNHSQSPTQQRRVQKVSSPTGQQPVGVLHLMLNKEAGKGQPYQYMVVDAQGNKIPAQIIFQEEEEKEKPLQSLPRIDLMNRGRTSSATQFKRESLSEGGRPDICCDLQGDCKQENCDSAPFLSQSMKSPTTVSRLQKIFARMSSSSKDKFDIEANNKIIDTEESPQFQQQKQHLVRVQSADKVNERQALEELRRAVRKNPRRFQQFMDNIEKQSEETEELEHDESLHNSESGQIQIQTETKNNPLSPLNNSHMEEKKSYLNHLKQTSHRSEINLGFKRRQTSSLMRSQKSMRGAAESSEAGSTVCVNLKKVLSSKFSGKQSEDSKRNLLFDCNTKLLFKKNPPETDDLRMPIDLTVASASPSVRTGPLFPPRMMNTSAKKLAQITRHSRQAPQSKYSNKSEDTPAFKHSLTKTNMVLEKLEKMNKETQESPAFVIVTDSSVQNQMPSMSSSQHQSANQRQRVDKQRTESANNSSHFRITPGAVLTGSVSFKSGTEPKSSSSKIQSQQTFGAKKKLNQRLTGKSDQGEPSQRGIKNLHCNNNQTKVSEVARLDTDFSSMLIVNANQQSTDWNPPATSPQRKSVDDTMRNIKINNQKNKIASPDVQSFPNLISNGGMKIYIKKDENLLMNSEKSSSLVTSYNSDAGGDQLRVREFKKADNSTKRSRTNPSSFNHKGNQKKLSPNRVREALIKMNQQDDEGGLDLKRMKSSHNARLITNPIEADCTNASKEINSSRAQCSRPISLHIGTHAIKSTLGMKSSLMSPVQISSDKTSKIHAGRISKQSQSKSRSNSRSSNVKGTTNTEDQHSNKVQINAAQPVSPLTPNSQSQFLLNPKTQNPDFETIRNKSNSGKSANSDVKSGELEPENLTDATRQHQENQASQRNNESQTTTEMNVPSCSSMVETQTNKSPVNVDTREQVVGSGLVPNSQGDFDAFNDAVKYFPYDQTGSNNQEREDIDIPDTNQMPERLERILMSSSQSNIKRRATAGSQILASVPENEEENKAEEHSSMSHSTYELRQTRADITKQEQGKRRNRPKQVRAQKSLIMQSKNKNNSFMDHIPVLPPLRQQLTTGVAGFADQFSNSTLNDNKDYHASGLRSKNLTTKGSITGAHFSQHLILNQKNYKRRRNRRQMATSNDMKNKKMRLMTSPQGSFVINGRLPNQETLTDQRRSQSSSRKSRDHHRVSQEELQNQKQRLKHINDAVVQIDSIFSSLMTPVNRKLNCGGTSKCSGQNCSVHHGSNAAEKTPQSDKNNFTSYMERKAQVQPNQKELDVNTVNVATKEKTSLLSVAQVGSSNQAIQLEGVEIGQESMVKGGIKEEFNDNLSPPRCPPSIANSSVEKSEDISEEIPDQQRIQNFTSQMDSYQAHLMPELTCKTIRELSIEDAMSSMGNLSANISPQIALIKNANGATGSVFGGSRKEKRRKSHLYLLKNGSKTFVRKQSVHFKVSPTQSPNNSSAFFKRQMTSNSEAHKLKMEVIPFEQKPCENQHRKKFANNRNLITSKMTSNLTCTECGMSSEDSPRGSQTQEVQLMVHDSDRKPQTPAMKGDKKNCNFHGHEQFIFVCPQTRSNRRCNTSKQLDPDCKINCEHTEISKGHTQVYSKDDPQRQGTTCSNRFVKVSDFSATSAVAQAPKTVQFDESPPTVVSLNDQSFKTTLSPNQQAALTSSPSVIVGNGSKQESGTEEVRPSEAKQNFEAEAQPSHMINHQEKSDVTNSTVGLLTVNSRQDGSRKIMKAASINEIDMLQSQTEAIYFKMTKTNSQSKGTQSVAETANFLGIGQGTPKSLNSKNVLGSINNDEVLSPFPASPYDPRRKLGSFPAPGPMTKSNSMQPRIQNKDVNLTVADSMIKTRTDPREQQITTKLELHCSEDQSVQHQSHFSVVKTSPQVFLHSASGNPKELKKDARDAMKEEEQKPRSRSRSQQNRGILKQLKKEKKLRDEQEAAAKSNQQQPVLTIQKQNIKFEQEASDGKTDALLKRQKSILKTSIHTTLAAVEEVIDDNQTTNEKEVLTRKESERILLSFQCVQDRMPLPTGLVKMRSETPAAISNNKIALESSNPRSNSIASKKFKSSLRLIKNVGKVYRSVSSTPQNTSNAGAPKFQEFFDLARKTKILADLKGTKLVDETFAQQLELDNKKKYDEARLKADIDARQNSCTLRQQFVSPDYHNARENSTPSAYKSSVKLQFGNNMAFQDFSIVDNFDMTPSNFNHDKVSHSSMHTYGGSSAAFYTSEMMFNPELYDVEMVVDSNDQSPMGRSMLSEYQFKVSSRGGNNSKEQYHMKGHNNSCSISELDIQKAQNIQVDLANANPQKMRFQSINQQSAGSLQNRDQVIAQPYIMITDVRSKPNEHHSQTINDPKKKTGNLGQHLLRPDWNYKKAMDQISNTTLSRSDLNFPLISRRHSSSEDSSRMASIITYENKGQIIPSNTSNTEAYKTAEVNQRTLGDLETKHAEQLLKTAEKTKSQPAARKIDTMPLKPKVSVDQEFSKKPEPGSSMLLPPTLAAEPLKPNKEESQFRRLVSMQNKSSPEKILTAAQVKKHRLHPSLIRQITEEEAQNLQVTVDKTYNMLHLPENKLLNMQTTTRSCATGRQKQMADLSSRVKTEGNISHYAKESISDNLLWAQSQNQNVSSDDQQSFSQSTINANQKRFNRGAAEIKKEAVATVSQFNTGYSVKNAMNDSIKNGVLTHKNATRRKYIPHTSTPTNLNSKRRITPEEISRQQSSEVKSQISRIRHTSITTTSCVSTKVCGKERINQYQVMQKIGSGSFSEVFLSYDVNSNKIYAMKVMNKVRLRRKTITMTANAFDNVKTEMAIMKKLDHPYILKLFEIIDDPTQQKLYLIIEYSKHGSVEKKIEKLYKQDRKKRKGAASATETQAKPPGLAEDIMRKYFSQLILALEYCHDKLGIIHRDIKPDNLLIHDNDNIKLSDFGVSELLPKDGNDKVISNAGSAYFFSPEACIGKQYRGRLNDIWACGITLFYMATGKYPFASSEYSKLYRLIQNTEPDYPAEMLGTPLHDLICRLLKKLPDDRIRINEIKNHPWITKNGTEPLQDVDMEEYTAPTEAELQQTYTKCIKRTKFIYHRKVQDAASAFN